MEGCVCRYRCGSWEGPEIDLNSVKWSLMVGTYRGKKLTSREGKSARKPGLATCPEGRRA
jgi:hypothetical protein